MEPDKAQLVCAVNVIALTQHARSRLTAISQKGHRRIARHGGFFIRENCPARVRLNEHPHAITGLQSPRRKLRWGHRRTAGKKRWPPPKWGLRRHYPRAS